MYPHHYQMMPRYHEIYWHRPIMIYYRLRPSSLFAGVPLTPQPEFTTAREKHRSVTAEDAAQAVADVERAIKPQPRFNHGAPLKSTMSAPLTQPRGNKTLGWFLNDNIFDKKAAPMKSEGASSATVGAKSPDDKKRRRGTRRGSKKTIDYVPGQAPSEGSVASEDFEESKQRVVPEIAKEDFWYYDVASDGYYYEQNGAKGWRRRMPNSAMQKIKEQELAQLTANTGKLPAAANHPVMNPQAQAAAQAALLQSALFSQPALKYYDPSSDGFFYEMASVDGWKRRQPAASGAASGASMAPRPHPMQARTSAPLQTSYGAALARGQMPRHCVIDDSSASSSVSEDTIAHDPFGMEAGFHLADSPFRLARPESLNFGRNDQIMPDFNADKFIQDLSFSGYDASKAMKLTRTPASQVNHANPDAWSARCGGWGQSQAAVPSPEEESMGLLLKGLEDIWSTPTPIKNN